MSAIVARYDADAADYARYWAPVLEATAGRLLDYVDPFVARHDGRVRVLEVGAGTGTLLLAALERWPRAEFVATDAARGMLDLARTPDTRRSFESMIRLAHQLAAVLGGSMVDDNGNLLDERAIAAIAQQLDAVRARLESHGLPPGSPSALRLFS